MKTGYIYVIKNTVNIKCYVGQTGKKIEERWKEHLYNATSGKRKQAVYNAMRKHGVENFYIEMIEEIEISKLDDREKHWVKELDTLSPKGYNMTDGGTIGGSNPMHNPQIAKKVSIHFIGDKNPTKRPEVKEKIRQKALGREISEETRMKMSRNNRGRGKFGELNTNSRSIARIDKNTNEVLQVYGAFKEAERWVRENGRTSALYQNIWQACNNKKPTAYGFKWKYVEEV